MWASYYNFNISSFSVQEIPSPYVSTYNGPSAVTSVDGYGAYLQQNDHFFELSCTASKCSWSLMDQKLDVGRDSAVLMYLPANFECWFYTNKSSLTLKLDEKSSFLLHDLCHGRKKIKLGSFSWSKINWIISAWYLAIYTNSSAYRGGLFCSLPYNLYKRF